MKNYHEKTFVYFHSLSVSSIRLLMSSFCCRMGMPQSSQNSHRKRGKCTTQKQPRGETKRNSTKILTVGMCCLFRTGWWVNFMMIVIQTCQLFRFCQDSPIWTLESRCPDSFLFLGNIPIFSAWPGSKLSQ